MADRIGQQFGHYRLVRLLGQGGFAEVYLGEHIHLGTEAAIKLLHTQLSGEDTEAFRKEARTIARLVHPYIVRVFDFGIEGETPYLVMDYAPGGTVRKRHPRGVALPLPIILDYIKQVADALQYAHDEHFIHRDIKPENLLVGRRLEILLSDFGIALLAQTSRSQSMQDVTGTASYMAPEQFQGKPRQASDQYALAIMIYEWLTGACPFHGSFTEIASQHLFVPPPPLREKVPALSPEVEQVVLTALAKDPHQRFASVRAFATAFEQASQMETSETLLRGRSPQPTDALTALSETQQPTQLATTPPPLVQSPEEPPLSSSAPTLLASSDTDGEPSASVASQPENASIPAAPLPNAITPPSASESFSTPAPVPSLPPGWGYVEDWHVPPSPLPGTMLYTYRGHSKALEAVVWSPDGTRIASASDDGTVQVWEALDGRHVFTYREHSKVVSAVVWSPDGIRIASGGHDKTVQVWEASSGKKLLTYSGHAGWLSAVMRVIAVAWSPDGTRIASGDDEGMVQVWEASSGKKLLTYNGHARRSWWKDSTYDFRSVNVVAWSPNGKLIASGSQDKTVQVWNAADGGNVFTYHGHSEVVSAVAWSPDGTRIVSGGWFPDTSVQVWNAADGSHVFTYPGHSGSVLVVAWAPNGTRIASGSADNTVQVWNAAVGGNVFTYYGHSDPVNTVAWSPDGTRIASGSVDVQVWQAV